MPDGRMFGMIPGDAGNAGCGFRMLDSCRLEMQDGRMPEDPRDADRAKDAGRAWRCRKSLEMPEGPGDGRRCLEMPEEPRDARRAWRCRKMPEDAGRCRKMPGDDGDAEDAWRCLEMPEEPEFCD